MMKQRWLFPVIVLLAILVLTVSPTLAHEGREVGEYELVIGWRVEPAYTDLFNGPELQVLTEGTGEPVEGLEQTLTLEVSFGPATKTLQLRPVPDEPGHYTANLIPTRPGDYTFRVTGMIGDLAI